MEYPLKPSHEVDIKEKLPTLIDHLFLCHSLAEEQEGRGN